MPRWRFDDRHLIACAALWTAAFLLVPAWHARVWAFAVTAVLILVNLLHAFTVLTRQRAVLVALNGVQIVLFGLLNYQLHCAFGPGHYAFDREPQNYDWIEFTA